MIVEHRFINQIVGVLSGQRDVSLINIADVDRFEVPELDEHEFPVATFYGHTQAAFTRWRDGSHWTAAESAYSCRRTLGNVNEERVTLASRFMHEGKSHTSGLMDIRTETAFPLQTGQEVFPEGTKLRTTIEDFRESNIRRLRTHFSSNVALLGDKVWVRTGEPYYRVKFRPDKKGIVIDSTHSGSEIFPRHYHGQRYRLDDKELLRDQVLDLSERGWDIIGSNGFYWDIPDIRVQLPESVNLAGEAATLISLAMSAVDIINPSVDRLGLHEIEAYATLKATTQNHNQQTEFGDDEYDDLATTLKTLRRELETISPGYGVGIDFALWKWDDRDITPMLASLPTPIRHQGGR